MRVRFLLFLIFLQSNFVSAQTSIEQIGLEAGSYTVGFNHYMAIDSSRTYHRIYDWTNTAVLRPIPISIWYPSSENTTNLAPLDVLDYMRILKEEEEWENLPNAFVLDWFNYPRNAVTEKNSTYATQAFAGAVPKTGSYPVVIYAPSFQASSSENFMM